MQAEKLTIGDLENALYELYPSHKSYLSSLREDVESTTDVSTAVLNMLGNVENGESLDWYKINRSGLYVRKRLPHSFSLKLKQDLSLKISVQETSKLALSLKDERLEGIEFFGPFAYYQLGLNGHRTLRRDVSVRVEDHP